MLARGLGERGTHTDRAAESADPFVAWNATILREFFSPAQREELVVLALAREELDDLAPELGGYAGLLGAVIKGPPWVRHGSHPDLARWSLQLLEQRGSFGMRPGAYCDPALFLPYGDKADRMPTYLPILAALVALHAESRRSEGGFYDLARRQLHLPHQFHVQDLSKINLLWTDLAAWTEETSGRYGRFRAAQLGLHAHVGQLRAQGIFSSTDAVRLAYVFARLGIRPGEQLSPAKCNSILAEIPTETQRLGVGLREASSDPSYRAIVLERIQNIVDDWDGQLPRTAGDREDPDTASSHALQSEGFERELGLSLHLTNGGLPWRLGWRARGSASDGVLRLLHSSFRWSATLSGSPQVTVTPDPMDAGAGELLELARRDDKQCLSITEEVPQSERQPRVFSFQHAMLRYLVFDAIENCLVERDSLPHYGPAYLLKSPDNAHFSTVIASCGISPEKVSTDGLPAEWELWFVADCTKLADKPLPDGREVHPQPRVLRLTGGVRIRRSGRVLFLPYDLPRIELDAPPGTTLVAHGLSLYEETRLGNVPDGFHPTSLRWVWLEVEDPQLQNFTIEARDPQGRLVGSATLRIATTDIPVGEVVGTVGLDRSGSSTVAEPFVVGMAIRGAVARESEGRPSSVNPAALGRRLEEAWLATDVKALPIARFLDSMALSNATVLPYGTARDRLRRYLDEAHCNAQVGSVMRDLRRRGFVEIATDKRGRWTAVAKVPATLWCLPVAYEGQPIHAVSGTLSFRDWSALTSLGAVRFADGSGTARLPVVRIAGRIDDAQPQGFISSPMSCMAIAGFSATLDEVRTTLGPIGFEELDGRATEVETFNPLLGRWCPGKDVGFASQAQWSLLRYLDPETGAHQLLSLRSRLDGVVRYRHVRDERLGTWIAYTSCIEEVEKTFPGVAPWPLHYDPLRSELWLPERMNLPYVLERAVMAASGEPPLETRLQREPDPDTRVLWAHTDIGTRAGPFDLDYDAFIPDGEYQTWLRYRWVPLALVQAIAFKLDCGLSEIQSGG